MAVVVNIHEAKTHFSKLIRRVMCGEEVVIASAGKPVARLVPYEAAKAARIPGRFQGQIRIAEDFDAPLPEDVLAQFEGHDGAAAR